MLSIEPFSEEHLPDAAKLLSRYIQRERVKLPGLLASLEEPSEAQHALEKILSRRGVAGLVGLRGGTLAGYMLGELLSPAPFSQESLFGRPRTLSISHLGAALSPGEDTSLLRLLYASLSGHFVSLGSFSHEVGLIAQNLEAREAWFSLGFGQRKVYATRSTDPLPKERLSSVEIQRAGIEQLEEVTALVIQNLRYQAGAPSFNPYLSEVEATIEEYHHNLLENPNNAAFLAIENSQATGIVTLFPGQNSGTVYLQHLYVARRGKGHGSALLESALQWAREAGYTRCDVSWLSASIGADRFFRRCGFSPLVLALFRQLDERISWAT